MPSWVNTVKRTQGLKSEDLGVTPALCPRPVTTVMPPTVPDFQLTHL